MGSGNWTMDPSSGDSGSNKLKVTFRAPPGYYIHFPAYGSHIYFEFEAEVPDGSACTRNYDSSPTITTKGIDGESVPSLDDRFDAEYSEIETTNCHVYFGMRFLNGEPNYTMSDD